MSIDIILKNKYHLGLVVIILSLIIYKLPFLSLPYYWDEASPYSVAVHTMYRHGLSLMPGAVPPFIARGHPLLFSFLAAGWMTIFGKSVAVVHTFCLAIAIITLLAVFIFCKHFFSGKIGFIACLLLATQPIFLVQSVFLLPEMHMAFWTIIVLYAFINNNKILYVIAAAAMLLTKETGVVLILTLFILTIINYFKNKKNNNKILNMLIIGLPVPVASFYFIIQKVKFGWFLFPMHLNYITAGWQDFVTKLPNEAAYLLIYNGRNGFSFFIILALLIIFITRKSSFSANDKKIFATFTLFIILYLIFCSINFYIPRYLLCVFPIFIIIGSVLIEKALANYKLIFPILIAGIALTNIYFYVYGKSNGDINYMPSIITDKQVVQYCEQNKLQDAPIYASSVMRIDLQEADAGYLTQKPFSNVQYELSNSTAYYILSSDEYDATLVDKTKADNKLLLLKRFEMGYAWREIYKVVR